MLPQHVFPALAGLLSLATAATIGPNDTPAPWEISSLRTFSPSGRPGSSPYSILNITITDPNTTAAGPAPRGTAIFTPTTAVCNATYVGDAPPWGQSLNCSATSYGYWAFEMLQPAENPSATTNFDVRFTHVSNVTVIGKVFTKVYVAREHFEVGKNLAGLCSASGVCSFGLKEDETPYLVNQTLVSCAGLCP